MKKFFLTGLVILLPLALTLAIVVFIFNLLTEPFIGAIKSTFQYYGFFEQGFLLLSANEVQTLVAQFLILILLVLFTILLGFVTRWFFFHSLLKIADYLLDKIPFIRAIYKTSQDVIKTIFSTETKSFKQVVLVPFPSAGVYSIGLVTRENMPGLENTSHPNAIAVFVPTTPNPTSGFLMMFRPADLIFLDMSIEDAFKYVISCGVILSPFKVEARHTPLTENNA